MKLLIALSLLASPLAAQQRVHITPMSPSDGNVERLWQRVISCAGPTRDTTKTFEQIKFFERDTVISKSGRVLKGEWVPPDTIYLTKGFAEDGWVVAHEMLHHALNGPPSPNGDDPHVVGMEAFINCGLAEFQAPKQGAQPLPAYQPGPQQGR